MQIDRRYRQGNEWLQLANSFELRKGKTRLFVWNSPNKAKNGQHISVKGKKTSLECIVL